MRVYWLLTLAAGLFFSSLVKAGTDKCASYLQRDQNHNPIGIYRVESLHGRQQELIDVSDVITERLAKSDPHLRVVNLDHIFAEGKLFLGFGRPNVYLGIPNQTEEGLGYAKVEAKSLKRADTKVIETHDRVQSGLLIVFKDLTPEQVERILTSATAHQGTRRWTCVNANCRILSDAGFTIGGESLKEYFFPVRLFKDILRYGLELDGQPVEFDIVKTTPGYLEDIGLSITHAVSTTLCRHGEKACDSVKKKLEQNTYLMKVMNKLGIAVFEEKSAPQLEKPIYESEIVKAQIPEDLLKTYDMDVSEPSMFGQLLRLLWGPHSLFEVQLPREEVEAALPSTLKPFPDPNPSLSTRLKKHFLFSQPMVNLIRSQLSHSYKRLGRLTHNLFVDMLRTHSEDLPNKYNFVVTGDRLIVMKLDIRSSGVDWVLSKHVLMSNYAKDVRFAGEIWKTADGTMHFNNNSGTYKPGSDLNPPKVLFEKLFPGVKIEAHGL